MKHLWKPYWTFLLISCSVMLFSSCSIERKIAKQYVSTTQQFPLLVLFPSEMFVLNLKHDEKNESFTFADAIQDTSLLRNSLILKTLNDDSLLKPFQEAFKWELGQYGYMVYSSDEMERFSVIKGPSMLVNVAQMEIQEYVSDYEDGITVGEDVFTKVISINAINIGTWVEIAKVDTLTEQKYPVLFASNDLTERWSGYFTQRLLTGEIQYKLEIDPITPSEIKSFARYLGRLYAAYTFDYLMNDFIRKTVPLPQQTKKYYRYDPYKKWIFTTENDRFVIMD